VDIQTIMSRIDTLLAVPWDETQIEARSAQLLLGATSVLEAVHGTDSLQVRTFQNRITAIEKGAVYQIDVPQILFHTAQGALSNVKGELNAGFVGTLSRTQAKF
jgi:hypothetical protein